MQQRAVHDNSKLSNISAAPVSAAESDLLSAIVSLLGPEPEERGEVPVAQVPPSSTVLAGLASGLMAAESHDSEVPRDPLTGLATAPTSLPRKRKKSRVQATPPSVTDPLPAALPRAQRDSLERFMAGGEGACLAGLLGNESFRKLSESSRLKLLGDLAQCAGGMGPLVSGMLSLARALDGSLLSDTEKAEVLGLGLTLPPAEVLDLVATVHSGRLTCTGPGKRTLLASLRDLSRQTKVEFDGKTFDARQLMLGVLRVVAGRPLVGSAGGPVAEVASAEPAAYPPWVGARPT